MDTGVEVEERNTSGIRRSLLELFKANENNFIVVVNFFENI